MAGDLFVVERREPKVGEYQVEYLNDLLVRLISESVGAA